MHYSTGPATVSKTRQKGTTMKDLLGFGVIAAMIALPVGLLLLARHVAVRRHREQFAATGTASFPLPTARSVEREEWHEEPTRLTPTVVLDTTTGEKIRVGVDGLPMTEADIAARTPSTALTVDTQRLTEILQLEETGEYRLSPATWAEITAAEQFGRDPLTSPVMPPTPLVNNAGNPALADTFYALLDAGGLRTDWSDEDSAFHFWDRETELAGVS